MSGKEQNGKKKRGMRPLEIEISIKTKKRQTSTRGKWQHM